MKKYYELKLNCARVDYENPSSKETGYIEVLPVIKETKTRILFKEIIKWETEYVGKMFIIAEKKGDYFEDIITGNEIIYNPNGVKDIKKESLEVLSQNHVYGLSCYEYTEIDNDKVMSFLKQIKEDDEMLKQYQREVSSMAKKDLVMDEMRRRVIAQYEISNGITESSRKMSISSR